MIRVYRLSAFSFEKIAPKEKAPQKEKGRFVAYAAGAATRRAVAFEKATQNNRRVRANKVLDKSKFTIQLYTNRAYLSTFGFSIK